MRVLEVARRVGPPDWLVGAGTIRDLVWDHLHGYTQRTPATDVDVVFFDPVRLDPQRDDDVEAALLDLDPDVPWEAKNQAAVHLWYERRFGFAVPPLASIEDAIASWPETATCVGVRLEPDDSITIVAPLGLDDLFAMILRQNTARVSQAEFETRLREKRLTDRWPRVRVLLGTEEQRGGGQR
jgi:uncharacterized protein